MGLFDFTNETEKRINSLISEINNAHENYENDVKRIKNNIDLVVRDFNDQIPIINTIRNNEFGPKIEKLYKFLRNFGDIGTEVSPFDFTTEKSRVNHHSDLYNSKKAAINVDNTFDDWEKKLGAGVIATQSLSGAAAVTGASTIGLAAAPLGILAPIAILPLAMSGIIGGLKKNKDNKDKIAELNVELENRKIQYRNDLKKRQLYFHTMEDAIKIAEIYRVNIKSISCAIDDTILPELSLVKSFLFAEYAKNKIISNEMLTDIKMESILLYKDTAYNKHYIFTNNAFHFYKMIVEFFSKPILTTLLEDYVISEEEKKAFQEQIEYINRSINDLKENSILNEVTKHES